MEPNYNQPRYGNNSQRTPGRANTSGHDAHNNGSNVNGNANSAATESTTQETSQTPVGFNKITPNVSRWNELKAKAQKEEEEWRRYKEANRPTSVYEPPASTGGLASMEEARQKQFVQLRLSKLQKKLKREEDDRRRRQEEQEENDKIKAKAREQAERLQEKRQQEEARRRSELREDQLRSTQNFLQKLERKGHEAPAASSSATRASSWLRAQDDRERQREEENSALQMKDQQRKKSEALEQKQNKMDEERSRRAQLDHRRVNAAFLDKLQGRDGREGSGTNTTEERREAGGCFSSPSYEDLSTFRQGSRSTELQGDDSPPARPESAYLHGRGSSGGEAMETDPEPDFDWALMRLQSRLPHCDRGFLEDILTQANGDYQQAYALLSETWE